MKILVACEESQAVCKEMRGRGHEAYSCDIIECSGGHPKWHIKDDVLPLINGNCSFKTMDGVTHEIEGKWDMIIAFPPCFKAGSKVMTYEGYKNIEDIQVGDLVLTHKGRFRKVLNTMVKPTKKMCLVKAENAGDIYCTPNHPFYTTIMKRKYNPLTNRKEKTFGDFCWMPPVDFYKIKDNYRTTLEAPYVVNVVDSIYELPKYEGYIKKYNQFSEKCVKTLPLEDESFWYMAGRWVGDGWLYYKKDVLYGIKICCSKLETKELEEHLKQTKYHYSLSHEDTVDKFEIDDIELANFLFKNFGKGAGGKHLPGFVTRLPENLAKSFLSGYFDSDGCITDKKIWYSSISEELIYGIKYMINKYYKVTCGITNNDNSNRQTIMGRQVNAKDSYTGSFKPEKTKLSRFVNYNSNYILTQYTSVEEYDEECLVYNLEVEEDESYTVNGLCVHNCTHLAVSGAPSFKKKREDGRQREGIEFFCQFLVADCDKIVIENPVNIISGDYVEKWFPDIAKKYGLPLKPTQRIHPWMFGDNYSKKTCLWIKGLPPLVPLVTEEPELEYEEWVNKKTGKVRRAPKWYYDAWKNAATAEERSRIRSKTFPGIAKAMAEQWG